VRRATTAGPNLNAMSRVARVATKLGLLLLGLTAISLITMPITQHLWTWDRFLHGGQDFETNALLILTALNLVLVLIECCKRNVGKLLALGRCFSIVRRSCRSLAAIAKPLSADLELRVSPPGLSSRQIPLLI
jgi:hypothetical protein